MTEAFRTASGAGRPPPIPPAATSHGTAQDAGESKAGEFKAGQVTGRGSGIQRSLVGAPLEEVRTRLIAIAARLEPHLEPQAMPIVVQARRVLADQTCRIAVIGQIKAGKSSFINVFTQRPDLLPTDINPWTAVVTSLRSRPISQGTAGTLPGDGATAVNIAHAGRYRTSTQVFCIGGMENGLLRPCGPEVSLEAGSTVFSGLGNKPQPLPLDENVASPDDKPVSLPLGRQPFIQVVQARAKSIFLPQAPEK